MGRIQQARKMGKEHVQIQGVLRDYSLFRQLLLAQPAWGIGQALRKVPRTRKGEWGSAGAGADGV